MKTAAVSILCVGLFSTHVSAQIAEDGWFWNSNNLVLPPSLDVGNIQTLPATKHQILPRGVNTGFDWFGASAVHAGLDPNGYAAFIGWGQVQWDRNTVADAAQADQAVEVRDGVTLACKLVNGKPEWYRLPIRGISGLAMTPNFAQNAALPSDTNFSVGGVAGYMRASFGTDSAFHFFPAYRESIGDYVCGFLYAFRARTVHKNGAYLTNSEVSGLIIGGGGDYWLSLSAEYPNNRSIGVGRLRALTGKFRWFGFTNASWASIYVLDRDGFKLP